MANDRHQGDKIPTWDNDPDNFPDFEDRVLWYERGLKNNDRKQTVARIVQRLTGVPWRTIKDLSKDDHDRLCQSGVKALLTFLRGQLVEDGVPEIGKRFGEYLGKFQRKPGQGMRAFVQHHKHLQNRVEEAIRKAEKQGKNQADYREELKSQKDPDPEEESPEAHEEEATSDGHRSEETAREEEEEETGQGEQETWGKAPPTGSQGNGSKTEEGGRQKATYCQVRAQVYPLLQGLQIQEEDEEGRRTMVEVQGLPGNQG